MQDRNDLFSGVVQWFSGVVRRLRSRVQATPDDAQSGVTPLLTKMFIFLMFSNNTIMLYID